MISTIPAGGKGEPVKSLAAQYPDLRRFIREGYVRYAFTRFGVPYVVSIQCLDIGAALAPPCLPRGLSRRRAFPESAACRGRTPCAPTLRPAGRGHRTPFGTFARFHLPCPRQHHCRQRLSQAVRARRSRPPIRKSAFRWRRRPSSIRSAAAPAATSRTCPPAAIPGATISAKSRSFSVGQCANGFGHQGEDIRPGACPASDDGPTAAIPGSSRSSPCATAS